MSAPVILVAERGCDAASLEVFAEVVNGPRYPLGNELAERGRDTILVGYGPDFMPRLSRNSNIATGSTTDVEDLTAQNDPGLSTFDDALYASTPPADSSWMSEEAGRWLLDRLP
ncbi:hypothetical protein [Nocardia vaccinii]|uniref:hypothetical protein n=1 Tax=Nocardia vaccinii TaxID=1822 RepID=UPI000832EBB4|nr:hypothetical protein [Nocardia vaccinii]